MKIAIQIGDYTTNSRSLSTKPVIVSKKADESLVCLEGRFALPSSVGIDCAGATAHAKACITKVVGITEAVSDGYYYNTSLESRNELREARIHLGEAREFICSILPDCHDDTNADSHVRTALVFIDIAWNLFGRFEGDDDDVERVGWIYHQWKRNDYLSLIMRSLETSDTNDIRSSGNNCGIHRWDALKLIIKGYHDVFEKFVTDTTPLLSVEAHYQAVLHRILEFETTGVRWDAGHDEPMMDDWQNAPWSLLQIIEDTLFSKCEAMGRYIESAASPNCNLNLNIVTDFAEMYKAEVLGSRGLGSHRDYTAIYDRYIHDRSRSWAALTCGKQSVEKYNAKQLRVIIGVAKQKKADQMQAVKSTLSSICKKLAIR